MEEEFKEDVFNTYNEEFFKDNNLIMMFSDERSGSNSLTLEDINIENNLINISITRKRGLTMDMAYLFMFIDTDKSIERSKVIINEITEYLF